MKYLTFFLLWQGASAFVVTPSRNGQSLLFSSAQEEDEDATKATSFADAGKSIIDAEDKKRMDEMGDFDSIPGLKDDELERMRAAVRARAESVGAKKADTSFLEEAKQRAMADAANRQQSGPGRLDLSQISTGNEPGSKKSDWDESLPTMMYDPADELTDEEQAEADKVGQLPVWQQAVEEIKESKWPNFGEVIREVSLMAVVAGISGAIIINWDGALRNFYTDLGMIPRPEDIPGQLQDLNLPEGFTNNMDENDLARITDEMNKAGKTAGLSSGSLDILMESQNPSDL